MEIAVYKIDGQDSGKKVVLDDTVFGIEPNNHALYLDTVSYTHLTLPTIYSV